MIRKIVYIVMPLVVLCSCGKTNIPKGENSDIVTFNTLQSTEQQISWKSGDKIGIFMVRESAPGVWETIVDDAFNRCYTTNGDGVFAAATQNDVIKTPKDGGAVNFVAYYPFNADLVSGEPCLYHLDMAKQSDLAKTNFLVSRNLQSVKVGKTALTLDFKMPLATLSIAIRTEMEAELLKDMTVAIHGAKYSKADYELLSTGNKLSNLASSDEPTMALVSMDGLLAEAMLLCAPNYLSADSRALFTLKNGTKRDYNLSEQVNIESGKEYKEVVILKDVDEAAIIDVLPNKVLDVDAQGARQVLSLLSELAWSVTAKPQWVTLSALSGAGSEQVEEIQLSFDINNGAARTAEIVFENDKALKVAIPISQNSYETVGYEASLRYKHFNDPLPDVLTVAARNIPAELLTWRFHSEAAFNAYLVIEQVDWVKFSYQRPVGYLAPNDTATFTIENNNTAQSREIVVKLVDYFKKIIKIHKIVQQVSEDYLEVSSSKFSSRGKGDKLDFVVTSRYDNWQVDAPASWIKISRGTTVANKTAVSLTCDANQGAERQATVTIRSGAMTQTIDVVQSAKKVQSYPFKLSYSAIIHAFAGSEFRFEGASQGSDNYANTAGIVVFPTDGTTFEQVISPSPYGFVVDPPFSRQFKSTEISGQTMVVSNYSGRSTKIDHIEVTIDYNGWWYMRRAEILNLPVPASLTDEDKLLYTITMTDIESSSSFKYNVTYEIK